MTSSTKAELKKLKKEKEEEEYIFHRKTIEKRQINKDFASWKAARMVESALEILDDYCAI